MARRTLLLLAVAALVVLLAVFSLRQPAAAPVAENLIPVVVAKQDISPFTVLEMEDLHTYRVPASMAEDTFGGIQEVAGQMITAELRKGNIVKRSEVLELDPNWNPGKMLILSFDVSTNHIIGGKLRPGHHIDLLVSRPEITEAANSEALWLARNLWVVGVTQSTGSDVIRPVTEFSTPTPEARQAGGGGGLLGGAATTTRGGLDRGREGPANLVLVAADRTTSRLIGYYLDAQSYNPWVYVRPEAMDEPIAPSRIDGLVFEDTDKPGKRDPGEMGLPGVTIKLFDGENKEVKKVQTDQLGAFSFGDLTPGVYAVEEVSPEGYTSTTPNRQPVYVIENQVQYVEFGNLGKNSLNSQDKEASAAGLSKPVAQQATATPAAAPTTATEELPCKCTLRISDRDGGAEKTQFAAQGAEVWAVLEFTSCPKNMPYHVETRYGATGENTRFGGSGSWGGGTGTTSIALNKNGEALQTGSYETSLKIRPQDTDILADSKWWSVGGASPAVSRGTPAPLVNTASRTGASDSEGGFGWGR